MIRGPFWSQGSKFAEFSAGFRWIEMLGIDLWSSALWILNFHCKNWRGAEGAGRLVRFVNERPDLFFSIHAWSIGHFDRPKEVWDKHSIIIILLLLLENRVGHSTNRGCVLPFPPQPALPGQTRCGTGTKGQHQRASPPPIRQMRPVRWSCLPILPY